MKTYPTIQEAFDKGTGHFFFKHKQTGQFICITENAPAYEKLLESEDFSYMQYEQVVAEAALTEPPKVQPHTEVKAQAEQCDRWIDWSNEDEEDLQYYMDNDDLPDLLENFYSGL